MKSMQRIHVIDATLREGNQAPGVQFSVEQSVQIARMLDALGVDMIECSHPFASELERERVRALASLGLAAPLLSHARARPEDIHAVRDSGAQWVGIFCGINRVSRLTRLGDRSTESVIELIRRSVSLAKSLGLKVRYTVEDGSRTPLELVVRVLQAAVAEGADRVCYADTLGAMTPGEFGQAVRVVRAALPATDLEVHVHDDRGFAMACAWMAAEAGANWISASVNGVGERCGITDLAALLANLDLAGSRALRDAVVLQQLSRYVGAVTRSHPDERRPILGRNAFTHTARLHAQAVQRTPLAYAVFDAARMGRDVRIAEPAAQLVPEALIVEPQVICATELKYHRAGPGSRYLMLDERFVRDARQYCIVRDIPQQNVPALGHVDPHRHVCDSLFMFLGHGEGLAGLTVEVLLEGELRTVHSPAAMFIPAGAEHSYRVLGGAGLYVNHVLAGEYNASLLELPALGNAAAIGAGESTRGDVAEQLLNFVASLAGRSPSSIDNDTDLLEAGVIDSIGILELFVFIEEIGGRSLRPEQVNIDSLRTLRRIQDCFFAPDADSARSAASQGVAAASA